MIDSTQLSGVMTRHLCLGARRPKAAVPRADVERRSMPVFRHRLARERARVAADAARSEMFFRVGHPDARRRRARYNPMGYHTGSVWPHDNALIARGLASYGCFDEACAIFSGLFDAVLHFDLQRMPELFCGFARHPGERRSRTRWPARRRRGRPAPCSSS